MRKNRIKTIFFDLDDTLYSSRLYYIRCMEKGKLWHYRKLLSHYKIVRKILHSQILSLRSNTWFLRYEEEFLMALSHKSHTEVREFIHWIKYILPRQLKKINLFPYVQQCLNICKQNNLNLGILSDFPISHKLEDLNLDANLFDYILSSEDFGMLKPNIRLFEYIQELSHSYSDEILYVGNHRLYDVQAAQNAGIQSAYRRSWWQHNMKNTFNFSSFKQLTRYILN